ncbi:hypothetical protein C8Q76DRAFT_44774 [Earliella scabrosa]|nr:hypothetical protein C8Q76DRAFT_44774 [Earliella scabrosa]
MMEHWQLVLCCMALASSCMDNMPRKALHVARSSFRVSIRVPGQSKRPLALQDVLEVLTGERYSYRMRHLAGELCRDEPPERMGTLRRCVVSGRLHSEYFCPPLPRTLTLSGLIRCYWRSPLSLVSCARRVGTRSLSIEQCFGPTTCSTCLS